MMTYPVIGYKVVTPLGVVVHESFSRDSCVLFARKTGLNPETAVWPVQDSVEVEEEYFV